MPGLKPLLFTGHDPTTLSEGVPEAPGKPTDKRLNRGGSFRGSDLGYERKPNFDRVVEAARFLPNKMHCGTDARHHQILP